SPVAEGEESSRKRKGVQSRKGESCTHIYMLGDGTQMLGFPCLNGKDPERMMRRIYEDGDALHILRDEMGKGMSILYQLVFAYDANSSANITFILRPTENVRILQKSQENGQNRTNTGTGTDRVLKSREFLAKPTREFSIFTCDDDDDDEEYYIPLKDMPQISPSITLAPVSSIMEPEDSLIMENEELSTIPEKESDEFIKSMLRTLFQSQESPRIHPVVIVRAFLP
ncbi:hypothetical protein Tco_0789059, partial [Tanacetum coccineum]